MDINVYISQLRSRLAASPWTREQLAARSGGELSASWISKFASGAMNNPTVASIAALDRALSLSAPDAPDGTRRTEARAA